MTLSGDVLWLGRPAPWATALGDRVREVEAPSDVIDGVADTSLVVVDGRHVAALSGWLRRPRRRPPVIVLVESKEAECAALRAGADEAAPADLSETQALNAVRRARARHEATCGDAELYRLMVESATDLVAVVDAAGQYVYVSLSAREQTGYAAEELVGTGVFDRMHPEDLAEAAAEFAAGMGELGSVRSVQFRIRTKESEVRYMEGIGRAVVGPDGATYGVVRARDVTKRKETEDRLLASEARYRTVVGALPDVISRIRDDGLVLDFHVPPVFETEFPADAMIGHKLQEIIPEDLAGKFLDGVGRMRETGEAVSYDYRVRQAGGAVKHREVRLAPLGEHEMISMIRDVTTLREHQIMLEQSRAEMRALATHLQDVREEERARLSREVHDVLGQQLTAIRLGIGWFGRHYPDDEAAQTRLQDTRETIDETIRHVRQIAADLRPGVLDDFGLQSAVEWQAKRFEERTDLTCHVDIHGQAEPPDDVATAIFRVFQEALTNVARHARAHTVAVTLALSPSAVRLTVADDGRGIDLDRTVGRRTLGLLGMRERARALGGTLEITSEPGNGTVVECVCPLDPVDDLPDAPSSPL